MAGLRLMLVCLFFTVTNVYVSSRRHNNRLTKTYYIRDTVTTWYRAKTLCEAEGNALATVRTPEEQGLLQTAIKNHKVGLFNWIGCYWIAASNVECDGSEFCWIDRHNSRTPVTWSHWGTSLEGFVGKGFTFLVNSNPGKCVKVWTEKADWYEKDCSLPCSFACEVDKDY